MCFQDPLKQSIAYLILHHIMVVYTHKKLILQQNINELVLHNIPAFRNNAKSVAFQSIQT